jgi:hypothetical protein
MRHRPETIAPQQTAKPFDSHTFYHLAVAHVYHPIVLIPRVKHLSDLESHLAQIRVVGWIHLPFSECCGPAASIQNLQKAILQIHENL